MEVRVCDDCKQRAASWRCILKPLKERSYLIDRCLDEVCMPCSKAHFDKHFKELGEGQGTASLPRE